LCTVIGCNSTNKKEQNITEEEKDKIESNTKNISKFENGISPLKDTAIIDTLELIVVQCANGYEYGMHNYDFNPVIETELNKFENIKVKPFPYEALMGVSYQGVFDKKYCPPIIEKVDVDILILTRFDKRYEERKSTNMKWGYELRIVKTETLEQINTIGAYNLNGYSEIEKHIKENINTLKTDIEKLK
jgi:hypothetical protein